MGMRSPRDCRKYTFSPPSSRKRSRMQQSSTNSTSTSYEEEKGALDYHMDVIEDEVGHHLPRIPILTPRTNKNDSPTPTSTPRHGNGHSREHIHNFDQMPDVPPKSPITISVMQTPSSNHHKRVRLHKPSPSPSPNALQIPGDTKKRFRDLNSPQNSPSGPPISDLSRAPPTQSRIASESESDFVSDTCTDMETDITTQVTEQTIDI